VARSASPIGRSLNNRSTTDNRWLEPTTPSAPAKEASRHFVDGRSHPSLAKEGNLARPKISSEKQVTILLQKAITFLCVFVPAKRKRDSAQPKSAKRKRDSAQPKSLM